MKNYLAISRFLLAYFLINYYLYFISDPALYINAIVLPKIPDFGSGSTLFSLFSRHYRRGHLIPTRMAPKTNNGCFRVCTFVFCLCKSSGPILIRPTNIFSQFFLSIFLIFSLESPNSFIFCHIKSSRRRMSNCDQAINHI